MIRNGSPWRLGARTWAPIALATMALAACSGSSQDGPGASSATTAPGSELPRAPLLPASAAELPLPAAPTLAPSNASPEVREAAAMRALRGEADPKLVAIEATEPGAKLDPNLRDELSPRAKPPSVKMGKATVTGKLPPEVIQRIVRQNFGRLRYCYQGGLKIDPELDGEVTVHFTIKADGSVDNVRDQGSTMQDAAVRTCVTKTFNGLSFPAPEGGTVTVTFPIQFSPAVE